MSLTRQQTRELCYAGMRTHVVSWAIMNVAVINLIYAGASGLFRLAFHKVAIVNPDMLNESYWKVQMGLSILQVSIIAFLFLFGYRLLKSPKAVMLPVKSMKEQTQLSGSTVLQLLEIWAVILVGIKLVDIVLTDIYRNFVADLFSLFDLADADAMEMFRSMYNNTHAFKYVGMLVAIALGIFITGVLLHDRTLKVLSAILVALFILTATFLQMGTYTIMNRAVAIVWSSVMLQLLQTFGMFGFSFYLYRNYRGI